MPDRHSSDPIPFDLPLITSDRPGSSVLAWPAPPYAAYALTQPLQRQEPCLIEGMNGRHMQAELISFEPAAGVVNVSVPPSRSVMPLRLTQFRRIALPRILSPEPPAPASGATELIDFHPRVDYHINMREGSELTGSTIGQIGRAHV